MGFARYISPVGEGGCPCGASADACRYSREKEIGTLEVSSFTPLILGFYWGYVICVVDLFKMSARMTRWGFAGGVIWESGCLVRSWETDAFFEYIINQKGT